MRPTLRSLADCRLFKRGDRSNISHVLVGLFAIGLIVPAMGPMVAAQDGTPATPTNNSTTTYSTVFSIEDITNESGINHTDPSDVANKTGTNYIDPSKVANRTGTNYTDPVMLRKKPGTLFAPNPDENKVKKKDKEKNKNESKKWSESTHVEFNCRDDWFNPEAYACKAKQGVVNAFYDGFLDLAQYAMESVMGFVFMTPAPQANGQPAILEPPTNWPWQTIYTGWYSYARGVGVLMWVLLALSILVVQTYMPVGVRTDYQLQGVWSRLLFILPLILFSFTILSLFLNLVNGIIQTVRPSGELAASTMSAFFGQLGAVGIAVLITWMFQACIFLCMFFLLWLRLMFIYLFAIAFPIMLPLAIIDVGPLSYIAEKMRGYLSDFVTIALLPLPMAASITAGLMLVVALNNVTDNHVALLQAISTSPLAGAKYSIGKETVQTIGAALIMLGSWFVAAISPILLWRNSTAIHGMMGRFIGKSLDSDEISEKVQEAKDNVDVDHRGGAFRSDDILDGSPYQREADFDSQFGGALGSDWIARPSADGPDGHLGSANMPAAASGSQSTGGFSDTTHEQPAGSDPKEVTAETNGSATSSTFDSENDPTGGWRDTARRYAANTFSGMFGGRFGGLFGRSSSQRGTDPDASANSDDSASGESTTNRQTRSPAASSGRRRRRSTPTSSKVEKARARGVKVTEVSNKSDLPETKFESGYLDEEGTFISIESGAKHGKESLLEKGAYQKMVKNMENRSNKDFLGIIRDPDTDEKYSLDTLVAERQKTEFEQSVERAHETFEDLDRQERARWDDES